MAKEKNNEDGGVGIDLGIGKLIIGCIGKMVDLSEKIEHAIYKRIRSMGDRGNEK